MLHVLFWFEHRFYTIAQLITVRVLSFALVQRTLFVGIVAHSSLLEKRLDCVALMAKGNDRY